MGVSAVVKNGEIQETASQSSVKQASASKNGSPGAYLKHRIYFPVCNLLTGRADAEYVSYTGIIKGIFHGRKAGTDPDNGFCREYQRSTGYG